MKVILDEKQLLPLAEAYQNSFSFEALSSIGGSGNIEEDNYDRYDYCVKYLGQPFAEGTSRVVFTLTDNFVLKLAKVDDYAGNMASEGTGEEQNKHGYELYQEIDNPLLPRILYCDKNYYYMI